MTPEQRDRENTLQQFTEFLADEQGQDIAEYAVLLAVILVLVVGTIRLIGSNANTVFSNRQFNSITVKVLWAERFMQRKLMTGNSVKRPQQVHRTTCSVAEHELPVVDHRSAPWITQCAGS